MQLNNDQNIPEKNHELPELRTKYTAKNVSKLISFAFISLTLLLIIALSLASTVKMDITIEANGVLEPARILHIHSPGSGRINNIFVNSGDSVKRGSMLLELDSIALKSKLNQVQFEISTKENILKKKLNSMPYEKYQNSIQIDKTEASVLRANAMMKSRLTDFFPGKNVDSLLAGYVKGTHVAIDVALADLITAQAEVKNRKSLNDMFDLEMLDLKNMEIEIKRLYEQKDMIKLQLGELRITSPSNGIVLTEGLDQLRGSYVTEGTHILDISPLKTWDAVLFVGEKDIHKISVGNNVKIEIIALKTADEYQLIRGKIISIAVEPNNNKEKYQKYSGLYRLLVAFENSGIKKIGEDKLKKGYSILGKIIIENDLIIKLIFNHFKELF